MMFIARVVLFASDKGQLHNSLLKEFVTSLFRNIWKAEMYVTCRRHHTIEVGVIEVLLLGISSLVHAWSSRIQYPSLLYSGAFTLLVVVLTLFISKIGRNWCTILCIQDVLKHVMMGIIPYLLSAWGDRVRKALYRRHLLKLNAALALMGNPHTTYYASETETDVQCHYIKALETFVRGFEIIIEDLLDTTIYFGTLLNFGWRGSMYIYFIYSSFKLVCDVVSLYMAVEEELYRHTYYRYISVTDLAAIVEAAEGGDGGPDYCCNLCSVCLCVLNAESIQLNCKHMFHEGCVLSLLTHGDSNTRKKCPLCRTSMKRNWTATAFIHMKENNAGVAI
jgi:hypothetical protein